MDKLSTPSIWRPFTQMAMAPKPEDLARAKNALLISQQGKEYIDAISSWWVINHGHCQPEIVEAIAQQVSQLDQVLFANFCHKPAQDLIQSLSEVLPQPLNKFFFSDNGSTAVEVALKMLIQYWQNLGESQRHLFISFDSSYHGDTVGAMSVSGDSLFTASYKEMLFQVLKVQQGRFSYDSVETFTEPFLEALEKHQDQLAGVIIEPLVQGAGGMIVWPKEALEVIGHAAKKKNIPLIFDEVMTGFGRTGQLFAFDHLSFNPDVLCLSKGLTGGSLPLSLTVCDQTIYDSFLSQDKSKMFFHGHSFTGNPISCAAATASTRLFSQKDYSLIWKKITNIHQERRQRLAEKVPLKDSRLCGTICALELDDQGLGYSSKLGDELSMKARKMGVFLRPLGSILYLLPPYSITEDQLHKTWDVIESLLIK